MMPASSDKTLVFPARDRTALWVFAINIAPPDVKSALHGETGKAELAARLLGAAPADSSAVELFPVSDLEGVGLAQYLADGHGLDEDDLAPHRARLRALGGYVLILHGGAFGVEDRPLDPGADATLVARFSRAGMDWTDRQTLHSDAAEGTVAPARQRPSDAAMSGRIAMAALLVIALLTLVMIWIA